MRNEVTGEIEIVSPRGGFEFQSSFFLEMPEIGVPF